MFLDDELTQIYNEQKDDYEKGMMEEVFPELKESDDRIRKAIIKFFELQDDNTTYSFIPKKDILAWLEKQGEQTPSIEGTFVNVDEVREDFIQEVYRVLDSDTTNDRANQIIDAFDYLPTSMIQKPTEWKPSEEQMKTFEYFVRSLGESGYISPYDSSTKLIYSLLEQLKQL